MMTTTHERSPMKNRDSVIAVVLVLACSMSSSLGTYAGSAIRWIEEKKLRPRLTGMYRGREVTLTVSHYP
jgi:hypothetical protein